MRICISWMFWVIKNYDSFSNGACKPAGPPPNIGRLFVRVDVFFHLSFWSVIIIASVCVKSVVSGIIFLEPFPLFDPINSSPTQSITFLHEGIFFQLSNLFLHYLIYITPFPIFSGFKRLDDWMTSFFEMFGSMLIFRRVTVANMTAR